MIPYDKVENNDANNSHIRINIPKPIDWLNVGLFLSKLWTLDEYIYL